MGPGGVLEGIRQGGVWIDTSTSRPTLIRQLEPRFRAKGAHVLDARSGQPAPPTAQHAIREARCLAHNLVATLRGGAPRPFAFKALGKMGALGHHSAVAEVFGVRLSGFLAWWLWRTIYLMKLPGLDRKLRVAVDWTLDLVLPPDGGDAHVWHLYVVRTREPERLAAHLRGLGVSVGRHYPVPVHLNPAFAFLGYGEGAFPVAERWARECLSLPISPGITEAQLEG